MRATSLGPAFISIASIAVACSGGAQPSGFLTGDDGGTSSGSGGSSGGSGSSSGGLLTGDAAVGSFGDGGTSSGGGTMCNVTNPNADMDKDGWTPMQGDCNDCDPNVNPGAIDVLHDADGGTPFWGNEDCSGMPGDNAKPCDQGLALDDVVPGDAARAIELCATASMTDRKYGVLSAAYVRADGTPFATPGLQVGIQSAWGTNVKVQGGQNMLAMSSGYSRTVGQTGACNGISCQSNATCDGTHRLPAGRPGVPADEGHRGRRGPRAADPRAHERDGLLVQLQVLLVRVPRLGVRHQRLQRPVVALVQPPPMGSYVPTGSPFGNVSFDSNNHPVSVNMGFFDVCDSTTPTRFATHCKSSGGTCPPLPSPYCPLGVGNLAGTGFDVALGRVGPAGATRWLKTQAPATPGSVITVRFAMWDAGNTEFDSTVLIDNSSGSPTVAPSPWVPAPCSEAQGGSRRARAGLRLAPEELLDARSDGDEKGDDRLLGRDEEGQDRLPETRRRGRVRGLHGHPHAEPAQDEARQPVLRDLVLRGVEVLVAVAARERRRLHERQAVVAVARQLLRIAHQVDRHVPAPAHTRVFRFTVWPPSDWSKSAQTTS